MKRKQPMSLKLPDGLVVEHQTKMQYVFVCKLNVLGCNTER